MNFSDNYKCDTWKSSFEKCWYYMLEYIIYIPQIQYDGLPLTLSVSFKSLKFSYLF